MNPNPEALKPHEGRVLGGIQQQLFELHVQAPFLFLPYNRIYASLVFSVFRSLCIGIILSCYSTVASMKVFVPMLLVTRPYTRSGGSARRRTWEGL